MTPLSASIVRTGSNGPEAVSFLVRAVLLDMDGTLVDSAEAIAQTWTAFAARHALPPEQVEALLPGRSARSIIETALPTLTSRQVAVEERWVREHESQRDCATPAMPGASRLLGQIEDGKWAVVTGASDAMTQQRLGSAGLSLPLIRVTADDRIPSKPAPDPFNVAARRLGVDPAETLVVEDSTAGMQSGHAAGAWVLAVGAEPGPCHARIANLNRLDAVMQGDGQIRVRVQA